MDFLWEFWDIQILRWNVMSISWSVFPHAKMPSKKLEFCKSSCRNHTEMTQNEKDLQIPEFWKINSTVISGEICQKLFPCHTSRIANSDFPTENIVNSIFEFCENINTVISDRFLFFCFYSAEVHAVFKKPLSRSL